MLNLLFRVTKKPLSLFEWVTILTDPPERQKQADEVHRYLCIGTHQLFFVSKVDLGESDDGKASMKSGSPQPPFGDPSPLSYLHIKKAFVDTKSSDIFVLQVSIPDDEEPDSEDLVNPGYEWQDGDKILIASEHRDMMLESITVCWQAQQMYKNFIVKKFPQEKKDLFGADREMEDLSHGAKKRNIDTLQVRPLKGYSDDFQYRGYSFFLREGFEMLSAGLRNGCYIHKTGWEVPYATDGAAKTKTVVIPAGVEVTINVEPVVSTLLLERCSAGLDDLRTTATLYKRALTANLPQFYILVNGPYQKRMNRTNDIAAWDGWEFFIRAKDYVYACILMRREYIPPLCDTCQDISVLLRCSAKDLLYVNCEVILDECRFIADSMASTALAKTVYKDIIKARLDALQVTDDAYRWMEGHLNLFPCHRNAGAAQFLNSVVAMLKRECNWNIPPEVFEVQDHGVTPLDDPKDVWQKMLSEAEEILLGEKERKVAWNYRVSRYLTYCIDSGSCGESLTLSTLVSNLSNATQEGEKCIFNILEFFLHVMPREKPYAEDYNVSTVKLAQLVQNPASFASVQFNERVMRLMISENHVMNEWRKRSSTTESTYEDLLSALLDSEHLGIGLQTLICRWILETGSSFGEAEQREKAVGKLVPALVKVMTKSNLALMSCATAALVNLCFNSAPTKNLLVQKGVMKLMVKQLKLKDDDLTLYTLYLLVNLTKTPHHRSIVLREGGLFVVADILTSSYQNLRKQKILCEVASVLGQLANDPNACALMTDDLHCIPCLIWVYQSSPPNTKLKANLLFALRQLCGLPRNQIKVGPQVIPFCCEEIALAKPSAPECIMNAILLLQVLANLNPNALAMAKNDQLEDSLRACGLQSREEGNRGEAKGHKFNRQVWPKVAALKERIQEAKYAAGQYD